MLPIRARCCSAKRPVLICWRQLLATLWGSSQGIRQVVFTWKLQANQFFGIEFVIEHINLGTRAPLRWNLFCLEDTYISIAWPEPNSRGAHCQEHNYLGLNYPRTFLSRTQVTGFGCQGHCWNLTDVTQTDDNTNLRTDYANRAIPGNVAMLVEPPSVQIYN